MTEPRAHPTKAMELAPTPATRPRTPSPVIQASENQARVLACRAARNHAGSGVAWVGPQQDPGWLPASEEDSEASRPAPGGAMCGCWSGMGVVFVFGVSGRFELEGGVFDVKVPDEAGLHLIEKPGGVPVMEAAIVDDHVRR